MEGFKRLTKKIGQQRRMLVRAEGMECWLRRQKVRPQRDTGEGRRKGQQRRMRVFAEGMECWMRQKERPAKENAGEGGGNGMLNEREGKASIG
jgi:hypothetical protein